MAAPNPNPPRPRFTYQELAAQPVGGRVARIVREGAQLKQQFPKLYYRDGTFNAQMAERILVPRASKGYGSLQAYSWGDQASGTEPDSPAQRIKAEAEKIQLQRHAEVLRMDQMLENHLEDYEVLEQRWQAAQDKQAAKLPKLHHRLNRDRSPKRQ